MSHSKCCHCEEHCEQDKQVEQTQSSNTEEQKKIGMLTQSIVVLIRFYQMFLSPLKPKYCGCRFRPTCSEYAKNAFLLHGPFKGAMLSIGRILRCNPWGGSGYDPVPPRQEKKSQEMENLRVLNRNKKERE